MEMKTIIIALIAAVISGVVCFILGSAHRKKTAEGLIQSFGNLDNIYENIDDPSIKKGVREKLISGKESAYLSKTLATINTSAPIEKLPL